MDRRAFLSKALWFLAMMSVSPSLLTKGAKATPTSTDVSLVKLADRGEGLRRALALLEVPDVRNQRVLIKPNFNTADAAPGSTDNRSLQTLIDELWERGAAEVIIGERSGPPNTRSVMEQKGIFSLAAKNGVKVVNFDELGPDELVHFQHPSLHWQDGFHVPKILHEVDHVIALGCLKTHQYGGVFTMALKLAVGIIPKTGIPYMRELHRSPSMRKMIAEINLAYQPSLYLIDGVEAFVSGGPSQGSRFPAGVTLASTDPIAIDAVGIAILKAIGTTPQLMNNPIFSQEQIARAVELGLGVDSPQKIRISADAETASYAAEITRLLHTDG